MNPSMIAFINEKSPYGATMNDDRSRRLEN